MQLTGDGLKRRGMELSALGEAIAGGARAIPLRHALTVIGRGRVAAIGDAACQVHGAHGSGIAQVELEILPPGTAQ